MLPHCPALLSPCSVTDYFGQINDDDDEVSGTERNADWYKIWHEPASKSDTKNLHIFYSVCHGYYNITLTCIYHKMWGPNG